MPDVNFSSKIQEKPVYLTPTILDKSSPCHTCAVHANYFAPHVIKCIQRHPDETLAINAKAITNFQPLDALKNDPESNALLEKIMQRSNTTDLKHVKASPPEICLLLIYLMQLTIKSRSQEFKSQCDERLEQLREMEKVVKNFNDEGRSSKITGLSAGFLGILSGVIPIVGPAFIPQLTNIFPSYFSDDKVANTLFEKISQITSSMSRMQETTGQTYDKFSAGKRHYHEKHEDLHHSYSNQATESMREMQEAFRSLENTLQEFLRMQQQSIQQLYSF